MSKGAYDDPQVPRLEDVAIFKKSLEDEYNVTIHFYGSGFGNEPLVNLHYTVVVARSAVDGGGMVVRGTASRRFVSGYGRLTTPELYLLLEQLGDCLDLLWRLDHPAIA